VKRRIGMLRDAAFELTDNGVARRDRARSGVGSCVIKRVNDPLGRHAVTNRLSRLARANRLDKPKSAKHIDVFLQESTIKTCRLHEFRNRHGRARRTQQFLGSKCIECTEKCEHSVGLQLKRRHLCHAWIIAQFFEASRAINFCRSRVPRASH